MHVITQLTEVATHLASHLNLAGPTVARLVIKTAVDLAVHKASHAGIHGISSRVRHIHHLIHKRGWLVDIAMLTIMTGFSAISEGGESHESEHAANE
jgi:hypothetical protein